MHKHFAIFLLMLFMAGGAHAALDADLVEPTSEILEQIAQAEQEMADVPFTEITSIPEQGIVIPADAQFKLDIKTPAKFTTNENGDTVITNPGPDDSIFASAAATSTECASGAFAAALGRTAGELDESDPEHVIQAWVYATFQDAAVIKKVLSCPEMTNLADDDTIRFQPIEYTFPGGRHIVVNYETQPKVLRQRLLIAGKKSLPETNPSPRVGAPNDPAVWTNTDPAWYGILVVESGTMDGFIGEDKNGTVSLKYIEDNIDRIFPLGGNCTSKSALASDGDLVNIAAHKTVGVTDDSNDYYVAGDVSLKWITWAEVALDVAITVATVGGGTVVLGATKMVRATKAAKGLVTTMRALEKSDKVKDFIRLSQQSARAAEELKSIDRATDAARYAAKSDEIKKLGDGIRDLEKLEDVRKYKTAAGAFEDVMKLRRAMKAWRISQRGNVVARAWRSLRAINGGNKVIGKATKAARASMKSGRIRDWLFHSTLKNAGRLAKVERAGGMIYGALKFVGDMYDWSETSTGEFTSGVDFKPLGLLSADDLQGQENVVNHGMWLMWAGDSSSPADDDAAYLQALDFAAKFHQDLEEAQENKGNFCSVDIFVVRPIIRNPGDDDAQLYYLIMNDQPWMVK
ncbi:MAG: hypothetical protein LBJ73_02490 [Rickettsiales bacterium]|jgi:hypothetical protein|nr:hypothetical protein [Rickettsiales bacterium]